MLTHLDLCGVTLGSNEMNWANRSCLTHLGLQHYAVSHAAIAKLPLVQWSCLRCLSIISSVLSSDMVQTLAKASMPGITEVKLSHTGCDAPAAKQLVTANWPQLEHLSLGHNSLDNAAMMHISEGK